MSRIVCVSNRVIDPRNAAQAGGVAVALADMLQSRKGLWFGWSGKVALHAGDAPTIEPVGRAGSALATLDLTPEEHAGYYLGYANSVLWPVFHSRVDLAQFECGYFGVYADVNRRFARVLKSLLEPGDRIWVHDYHFIGLAAELRALGVTNPIGFFLHIPFPPSQAFLAIPEHLKLAYAFSAYDLVGLQTTSDVANLLDYLEHGAPGRLLPDGRLRLGERIMSIGSFPIGIDPGFFKKVGREEQARLAGPSGARRIIGVDRLDYTKGLPQKFRAFGRLLQKYPGNAGQVVLTQIAAPTRDSVEAYADIRKELEHLSGSINGTYSDFDWVPIHYIHRATSRRKLAAIYRASEIALVTPLRDGMNLVAKEYVAAQDPEKPGVLILSRFAGAAEQMRDALVVNPYNIEEMADAIETALNMSGTERRRRHAALLKTITAGDVEHWRDSFVQSLERVIAPGRRLDDPALPSDLGGKLKAKVQELKHAAVQDRRRAEHGERTAMADTLRRTATQTSERLPALRVVPRNHKGELT